MHLKNSFSFVVAFILLTVTGITSASAAWQRFELAPAVSASANGGIAAVSRIPDSMEVWWVGANGSVQGAFWYAGGQWQRYELAPAGSVSANGGIAAVSRIPDSMEVWWVGANGSVQDAFWYAGGQWQRFELAPAGSASGNGGIAAVSRIPDSMEVWWVGTNGSVQDAFWYAPPPITTRQLTISRHNTAALTNAEADSILNDASTVLQVSDGPDDVACPVALVRSGDVGVFNTTDGSLDTAAELGAVFNLPGNVKVVGDVNFCANQFNTSYIGCGQTPGASFITERFTANQEGILWAHEFGHNQGLPHRDTSTNNIMYRSIGTNRLRINQEECNAFMGPQGLIAAADAVVRTQASTAGGAPMPVEEFVTQIYFEGLPLDKAAEYGKEAVQPLLGILADPSMVRYHENAALTLGMIGEEEAVEPLIAYVRRGPEGSGTRGAEATADDASRAAYKGRVGAIIGLGYLANRADSERAVDFLIEQSRPEAWRGNMLERLPTREAPAAGAAEDLSKYAITALGFSADQRAAERLRSLASAGARAGESAFLAQAEDVIGQSLQILDEVSRKGLVGYYARPK